MEEMKKAPMKKKTVFMVLLTVFSSSSGDTGKRFSAGISSSSSKPASVRSSSTYLFFMSLR